MFVLNEFCSLSQRFFSKKKLRKQLPGLLKFFILVLVESFAGLSAEQTCTYHLSQ